MDFGQIPAERATKENLFKDFQIFENLPNVKEIINALPYGAAILNPERQIIYANNKLIEMLNQKTLEELLGFRPGEAISCIHSDENPEGCGTTESCNFCGVVRTIRQCQILKLPVKDECRITSTINNEESSYDLFIMASPFYVNNIQYIILTLNDISSEKRKLMLEKIFFHDVINTAGTLRGIIDLMKDADNKLEMNKYIKLADFASNELVEEINAQRELILAENNELIIKRKPILSTNILRDVVVQILYHPISVNRSVIIDKDSAEITFTTDERILKRILINTLKNALEATPEHGKVKIGCSVTNRDIIIWVHNTGFIRREIQLQIFMRSFSTKDHNRGLGTYSMKLLTEKYLGGKISFETNEKNGTKFFIKLPI